MEKKVLVLMAAFALSTGMAFAQVTPPVVPAAAGETMTAPAEVTENEEYLGNEEMMNEEMMNEEMTTEELNQEEITPSLPEEIPAEEPADAQPAQ